MITEECPCGGRITVSGSDAEQRLEAFREAHRKCRKVAEEGRHQLETPDPRDLDEPEAGRIA